MSMYIQNRNGDKNWYLDYRRHRLDGPAVERANGSKEWWVSGKRHRRDGPAMEYENGNREWWVADKEVSKSEFVTLVIQRDLKVLLLSRVINPFCEVNVTGFFS